MHVVVVGAGVVGLLTALECGRAGATVTVLDQGPIPNPAATSFDRHRIVRALYPGDPASTCDAARAYLRWVELAAELGPVFHEVGAVTSVAPDEAAAQLALLDAAGMPARLRTPAELAEDLPQLRFPAGRAAIVEDRAGVLLADRVLTALVDLLAAMPGIRLLSGAVVTAVRPSGRVELADGSVIDGDGVACTAGPWSRALLPAEVADRLTLFRQTMVYCELPDELATSFAALPAVPAFGTDPGAWLVPPVAGTALKFSSGVGCRAVDEVTDRVAPDAVRDLVVERLSQVLVGFRPDWVRHAADAYYLADDGRPLICPLDGPRLWAFAACGGTSFKLAPVIADTLRQRVMESSSGDRYRR